MFESLWNSSDSSRKHIFTDFLLLLFYDDIVSCVYSTESPWVYSTYHYCVEDRKDFPKLLPFASWPCAMINPHYGGSNYPYFKQSYMLPTMFEPLKFDCTYTLAKIVGPTITKTRLYNFDPLQSHFYIVKLGFTGVYIIFLISAQKHRLWVLVRTASARRF